MRALGPTLAAGICVSLMACGAATKQEAATPSAATAAFVAARTTSTTAAGPAASQTTATSCQAVSAAELAQVSRRIYAQAVNGRNVVSSLRRLGRSTALASAVAGGNRAATRAALAPLIKHQIVRIDVYRGRRRLVRIGGPPAFAPVQGRLRDATGRQVGRYLLTVTDDRAYAGITKRLTGADVLIRSGARQVIGTMRPGPARIPAHGTVAFRGTTYRVFTTRARAFPSGSLRISVLVPPADPSVCGTSPAGTRLNTIGFVARRLFAAETHSRDVAHTLRYAAHDPAFRKAVAANDPVAMRAAIVGFFRNHHFHIVRVRVTRGSTLLFDLGGPYVLAPAGATVRGPDGSVAGRFSLAVQDDTGYIKLVHRFTGAAVLLRTPAGQVPGSTLDPGPSTVPDLGSVTYRGQRYGAYSFTGTAFPSGPLRISVLVPSRK